MGGSERDLQHRRADAEAPKPPEVVPEQLPPASSVPLRPVPGIAFMEPRVAPPEPVPAPQEPPVLQPNPHSWWLPQGIRLFDTKPKATTARPRSILDGAQRTTVGQVTLVTTPHDAADGGIAGRTFVLDPVDAAAEKAAEPGSAFHGDPPETLRVQDVADLVLGSPLYTTNRPRSQVAELRRLSDTLSLVAFAERDYVVATADVRADDDAAGGGGEMAGSHEVDLAPLWRDGANREVLPQPGDVRQGRLGDCWLEAALISLVASAPDKVMKMVKDEGATVVVTLYRVTGVQDRKTFTEDPIKIAKSRVVLGTGEVAFDRGRLWVGLIEKAWTVGGFGRAEGRSAPEPDQRSYGDLASGEVSRAFEVLTGQPAQATTLNANSGIVRPVSGRGRQALWTKMVEGFTPAQAQTWETWFTAEREAALEAEADRRTQHGGVLRHENLLAALERRKLPKPLLGAVSAGLQGQLPGKRGTGRYSDDQLAVYDQVAAALKAGLPVGVGTRVRSQMGDNSEGEAVGGAGEFKFRGLAADHGYAVEDAITLAVNEASPLPSANEASPPLSADEAARRRFIVVRNPWHQYARSYRGAPGGPLKAEAEQETEGKKTGVSVVELSDFTKRFAKVHVGARMP